MTGKDTDPPSKWNYAGSSPVRQAKLLINSRQKENHMYHYLLILVIASSTNSSPTTIKQEFSTNDSCLQVMNDVANQTKEHDGIIYSQQCYRLKNESDQ